ncbi:MAG: 30S ribosomal protein S12 methylthiotransferase RimO [Bacillota bacterium]
MKVGVISLGCAKNLVDTEVMLGLLRQAGYEIVSDQNSAEIMVINTCGFIESAKQESINTIIETGQLKNTGNLRLLLVAGCLSQRYREELLTELPEIDAIIGTGDVTSIVPIIERALHGERVAQIGQPEFLYDENSPRVQSTPKATAYVKIADGCDNCCSYCIIPQLRGHYRSRTVDSIVTEVERLAEQGVREFCLIAQDTTRYGLDRYGEYKLPELLHRLAQIEDVKWIRLLYCYPTHFNDEIIAAMASEDKVCKYIDLPLQHSEDRILGEMNRRGDQQSIRNLLAQLRQAMPTLVLRTSLIVGFPGETQADVDALERFVRDIGFDHLGVFTYSQEEGTLAGARNDQVDENDKESRRDQIMRAQAEVARRRHQRWVGQVVEVLVEGINENGHRIGRFFGQAPGVDGVIVIRNSNADVGQLCQVKVTGALQYDLVGEECHESCE